MKVTNSGLQNDAETQDVSFETIFSGTDKAWSQYDNTSTLAGAGDFNISTYTDLGVGFARMTYSASMADTNGACGQSQTTSSLGNNLSYPESSSAMRSNAYSNAGSSVDISMGQISILGDLA